MYTRKFNISSEMKIKIKNFFKPQNNGEFIRFELRDFNNNRKNIRSSCHRAIFICFTKGSCKLYK